VAAAQPEWDVGIEAADADDPRVAVLIADHLAEMEPTAPVCSRHALTVEQVRDPAVRLWVAQAETGPAADLLGSVALKALAPGHVELKTMRVAPAARGRGLGRMLLAHALEEARRSGAGRVSLETGTAAVFGPARALYESAGFTECTAFGDYRPDRYSVFLTIEV